MRDVEEGIGSDQLLRTEPGLHLELGGDDPVTRRRGRAVAAAYGQVSNPLFLVGKQGQIRPLTLDVDAEDQRQAAIERVGLQRPVGLGAHDERVRVTVDPRQGRRAGRAGAQDMQALPELERHVAVELDHVTQHRRIEFMFANGVGPRPDDPQVIVLEH